MLKFRYLFDNPDLMRTLLKNWDYDEDSEELFQYFRISANAIYPLRIQGEICYLCFSPVSEKSKENVLAELAFLDYLRSQGYPAMKAVKSRRGEEVVKKETSWGDYYASVKRWTHRDVIDWIEKTLDVLGLDQEPMRELALLRHEFDRLTITQDNYGLIHYNFEPDNVFYDESNQKCSVIDFDDAMYHWFVMDILQALEAIRDEMELDDCSHQQAKFLQGYLSVCDINENLLKLKALFNRFARLYQHTRVARAIEEHLEDEPDWMVGLRVKLERLLMETRLDFGE
ncbi:MAG: hypothetical protein CVU41_13105 [Chloroflexi bacterium HGW-Chloroflexi-3]|nr:MAG: hypothetical protein CVU41_13105 [Chloroflexi bacterium HGW-Chloroflexi-3]